MPLSWIFPNLKCIQMLGFRDPYTLRRQNQLSSNIGIHFDSSNLYDDLFTYLYQEKFTDKNSENRKRVRHTSTTKRPVAFSFQIYLHVIDRLIPFHMAQSWLHNKLYLHMWDFYPSYVVAIGAVGPRVESGDHKRSYRNPLLGSFSLG